MNQEELQQPSKQQIQDNVLAPKHYTWLKEVAGVEPIDIARHLDFNIGCCVKYLLRHNKDGNPRLQDLLKAKFYLEDEINNIMGFKPEEPEERPVLKDHISVPVRSFRRINTKVHKVKHIGKGSKPYVVFTIDTPSSEEKSVEDGIITLLDSMEANKAMEKSSTIKERPHDGIFGGMKYSKEGGEG